MKNTNSDGLRKKIKEVPAGSPGDNGGKSKGVKRKARKGGKYIGDKIINYLKGNTKRQKLGTKIFFGKKFTGLILLFLIYSMLLLYRIRGHYGEDSLIDNIFGWTVLNDPYAMGTALVFTFMTLTVLFENTAFKEFFFGKNSAVKQIALIPPMILGYFIIVKQLIDSGFNLMPLLLTLDMIWLLFQGTRLYFGGRKFATRVEARFLARYSFLRFLFVLIMPSIILILLTILVWTYRYYLILIVLDILVNFAPVESIALYGLLINFILPFLYISLISIFVLIALSLFSALRRAENRRVGIFDTFTYSMIVFFMFIYLLYQVSLYLIINDTTQQTLRKITGGNVGSSYLFFVEFAVSMFFLYRIIRGIGVSFEWNMMFFNKDALIMLLLGTIMGQTVSRLSLFTDIPHQKLGPLTDLLTMDHILIPIIIMIFLGVTVLLYYLKPRDASMFMRIVKQTVDKEDRAGEIILKYLKREFIKRGSRFPLRDVERQLVEITGLNKAVIMSVIKRIAESNMDVELVVEETPTGKEKYIDFVSITEIYQKKKVADARARAYMTERLVYTLSRKPKKITLAARVKNKKGGAKALLGALDSSYYRKTKSGEKEKEKKKVTSEKLGKIFIDEINKDTIDLVYEVIKKEYIERVTHPEDYPDCRIKVSDVADKVFKITRVSAGILYPLLGKIADDNPNIVVIDETGDPGTYPDKYIDFQPIDDFEVSDALMKYRPHKLRSLKKNLWLIFRLSLERAVTTDKMIAGIKDEIVGKREFLPMTPPISEDYTFNTEDIINSWRNLLGYMLKNYNKRRNIPKFLREYSHLRKLIRMIEGKKIKSRKSDYSGK